MGRRQQHLRAGRRRVVARLVATFVVIVGLQAAIGAGSALASSLTNVSAVTLSTTAGGATGVSYKFSFNTTSALVSPDKLTVAAPAGTVLPPCPVIHDDTTNANVGGCGTLSNGNATATYAISPVGANDHVSVELDR